jgi:hypothetical protein
VKITKAKMKFIKTQARRIIDCCQAGLFHKLYSADSSFIFLRISNSFSLEISFQNLSKSFSLFFIFNIKFLFSFIRFLFSS